MMNRMKRRLIGACCRWVAIAVLALSPATALAAEEVDTEGVDARVQGYSTNVILPKGSEGMTWVIMIVLGVICCGGLFKDAKRTHLD
jgi:hypothetical protein